MLLTTIVAATSASVAPAATPVRDRQLSRLVFALLRPYRVWLIIVFSRNVGRNCHQPRGALAAQAGARRRAWSPQASGLARLGPQLRLWTPHARCRVVRGGGDTIDR